MMKRLFSLAVIGSVAAMVGCGPANFEGSDPTAPPDSLIDRDGDAPIDSTQYEWVDYEFIVSVFTDVLGQNFGGDASDPENAPLAYLDARKSQVGAANYDDILPDNAQTGTITAPGYKTLVFSGVSACGRAMENGQMPNLFPNIVGGQAINSSMLDTIYLTLLSRYPTDEERAVHQTMWDSMETTWQDELDTEAANPGTLDPADVAKYQAALGSIDQANTRKAAASCGVLITSMEFLTVN